MTGLISVTKTEARSATETLTRAFLAYPLLKYYYPDDVKRAKLAYYFFAASVYLGLTHGEVYTTSQNMEGVAVWILAEQSPKSIMASMRAAPFSVSVGLMRHGVWKMKAAGDQIDAVKERIAPTRHMFLQTLGVDPQHQGQGYANQLITPMLNRLDEEKLPCYLETLSGKNVGLYEHFGFKMVDASQIPGTELTSWAMLRKPPK